MAQYGACSIIGHQRDDVSVYIFSLHVDYVYKSIEGTIKIDTLTTPNVGQSEMGLVTTSNNLNELCRSDVKIRSLMETIIVTMTTKVNILISFVLSSISSLNDTLQDAKMTLEICHFFLLTYIGRYITL